MIAEAIEKIIELKRPEVIEINDKDYRLSGYNPVLEQYPDSLTINNLTGIVDYIGNSKEVWDNGLFIHVEDFNKVILYQGMAGNFNQRVAVIVAGSRPCQFRFGHDMGSEEFIISLHSMFLPDDDQQYLLKMASGIKIDKNATITDDGVSQTVQAKQGLSSLVTDIPLKPLVALSPFRTFNEVEQPESRFIFRMSLRDDCALCALHECDGEAWKQDAIQKIKVFFKEELPDVPVIA